MRLFGRKPAARRGWIAVTAADAKATPGGGEPKALPQGTILTATLAEDAGGHWRIKDAEIEGKALPGAPKVLEKTEWALLPEATTLPPAGISLDAAALSGRRWSFAGGAPFILEPDGWIAGAEPLQGWALRQGVLYLFGTGGRTAWMSTALATADGTAQIAGLNFGNPDAAQPAVLHETPIPEVEREASPETVPPPVERAVEHYEPEAMPVPGIMREPDVPAPPETLVAPDLQAAVETTPAEAAPAVIRRTLCLRGLRPLLPHLKNDFAVAVEGFSSNRKWNFPPVARAAMVHGEAMSDSGRALFDKLPGLTADHFASRIGTLAADIYVLSFHAEGNAGTYRSRSTGMILPLQSTVAGNADFRTVPYKQIARKAEGAGIKEADWTFLREEFEYIGDFDAAQIETDIDRMFAALRDKLVIVLMLNTTIGRNNALLRRFARINDLVGPLAERHNVRTIETADFVRNDDDLDPANHDGGTFSPKIYKQMTEKVLELIGPA